MDGMDAPNLLSVHEAMHQMQAGSLSPLELKQACMHQIDRLNPRLNAFITVCDPAGESGDVTGSRLNPALSDPAARRSNAQHAGAVQDVPIAVKDLFETAKVRTTAGALFFQDYVPNEDAAVVRRIKDEGAVLIGKTNMHEIALGITTLNPHYGTCHNPWDEARISGGSSGGSAVAVAAGMALAALGTDTGGSIRIPAALCGVVGFKPTYGRVSLRGVIPLSWNLDHAGPLTRTVRDAALLLQVISGYDPDDPYSANVTAQDYRKDIEGGIAGWRVAIGAGIYVEAAEPEVVEAVHGSAEVLGHLGAVVKQVDVAYLREAAAANGVMTQADGAAFHRQRLAEHPDWFGEDVRRRLEAGRSTTSTEYSLARHAQTELKHRFLKFFGDYDILVLPTTPVTAPLILGNDAVEQARPLTRFTAPFNLAGLPAISIPCGMSRLGLPIGLQIVGPAWNESRVLQAARAYERETDWGSRHPPLV